VAAALLATRLARGRLASPFTAREGYRQEWTGLSVELTVTTAALLKAIGLLADCPPCSRGSASMTCRPM
jgi:hypothetical protein